MKIWMWLLVFAVVIGFGALRTVITEKRKKSSTEEEQKRETA